MVKTSVTIIVMIVIAAALIAGARQEELTIGEDSYVAVMTPAANYGQEDTLSVAAGALGTCTPSEISYLRFDLGELKEGPISNAVLHLTIPYAAGSNSGSLVLYAAPDVLADGTTTWQEGTLTWSNRPSLLGMERLASMPIPTSSGTVRLHSRELAAAINGEASFGGRRPGDNVLSLALLIEGCTSLNSIVRFGSAEAGSAAAPSLQYSLPLKQYLPLLQ